MSTITNKNQPYLCECGCEQYTEWSTNLKRWKRMCAGHNSVRRKILVPDMSTAPLCKCGQCGERVTWHKTLYKWNTYIRGHWAKTPKARQQLSSQLQLLLAKWWQDETYIAWQRQMRSVLSIAMWKDEEYVAKQAEVSRQTLARLWQDDEFRRSHIEKIRNHWHSLSDEEQRERLEKMFAGQRKYQSDPANMKRHAERMRKHMLEVWQTPGRKEQHRQRMLKRWENKEYAQSVLNALQVRPNKLEQLVDSITCDAIRYVGDGAEWRIWPNGRHKNPDFIIDKKHRVIEIWGDYWHRNDDPMVDIEMWNRLGYECLIIWEHQVHEEQEAVLDLVSNFVGFDARA